MRPEIQRIPAVGQAQVFATEKAMRVWIDPAKLVGFNLCRAGVSNAIGGINNRKATIVASQRLRKTALITIDRLGMQ